MEAAEVKSWESELLEVIGGEAELAEWAEWAEWAEESIHLIAMLLVRQPSVLFCKNKYRIKNLKVFYCFFLL